MLAGGTGLWHSRYSNAPTHGRETVAVDALTIAALIVSLLTVIALIVVTRKMNRDYQSRLRCAVRQLQKLHADPALRDLCSAIQSRYPDLCAGIDYELDTDGKSAHIRNWMNAHPEPSREEVNALLEGLRSKPRAD